MLGRSTHGAQSGAARAYQVQASKSAQTIFMCGIAGLLNADGNAAEPDVLLRMISMLRHRGPDAAGVHVDRNVGLAHARLSIIDLSGGAQPMHNEDQSLWITYN